MQGGGGRHSPFGFGGPFAGFGDPFAGFGGFGHPGNLMSSFFGGANPFDDPFFTNPFGSMMQPRLLGPSMFGPQGMFNGGMGNAGMFGPQTVLNQGMINSGAFTQQAPEPSRPIIKELSDDQGLLPSRPKGPIIKELSSDDEDDASGGKEDDKNEGNCRKHPRTSKGPYVEEPDDQAEDSNKRPKHGHIGREFSRTSTSRPQPQTFMFQSSTVTYGGPNGACYTSSTTKRTGRDGITLEEHKEADTATRKATHQISRGIGNKGHSLTRKLNSDGQVNTLQALHNLDEDELSGFEETWQRNTGGNLPGWDPRINMLGSGNGSCDIRGPNQMSALPAPDQSRGSTSAGNSWNGSFMGRPRRT